MGKNLWNETFTLDLDQTHKIVISEYIKHYSSLSSWGNTRKSVRRTWIENNPLNEDSKRYIISLYEEGYGLKILARALDLSYTVVRNFFQNIGYEIRRGKDVVTEKVRKIRSDRVKGNKSPWYNWPELHPEMGVANSRGLQGYYKRKDTGEYIWLRSTWEYIFVKWLEFKKSEWYYEPESFKLANGETYRPDFKIRYKDKVSYIEIKGTPYSDRLYKVNMFRKEYGQHVIIIDNISHFCKSYGKELKEWKRVKLSKAELNQLIS